MSPIVSTSALLAVLATAAAGCIQAPPTHLIGGGAGDSLQHDGEGGSEPTTTDPGSGGDATAGVGGSGPSSGATGGASSQAGFAIALDEAAPASDLMADAVLHLTITPKGGFAGDVALSAFDLPDGVTATFGDDAPHLSGAPKTVKVTLHVDSTTKVGTAPFSVTAHATGATKSASGTLKVNPAITIHVPHDVLDLGGTQDNPFKTAYGPYPIVINADGNMVTVKFMNDDDQAHEIHSGMTFGHDPGSIPAHTMDSFVRHVPMGQYDFYLHDQGDSSTPGQIVIQ